MTEESQVADYFVVAGLPDDPQPMDDYTDGTHLKQNQSLAPITDITVIFPSLGEVCPDGWQVLYHTPTGLMADLNYGSLHSPEAYICFKRGRHKPPLVDIGILYENKERVLPDSKVVLKTPYGRIANVNNANTKTFITYRRARKDMPANELVVTNICVIITSKGEKAPHAFCVIKKNLNKGVFAQDVFLCYKKSVNRANLISYKPGILCRYPAWDRPDWKLHSNVPLFCLPMGATLEVWPPEASQPHPVFSTFVLTVSDAAEKIYGSAVTFYERYPVDKLTEEQLAILEKSLESNKLINSDSSEKNFDYQEATSNDELSEESSSFSRRSLISGCHTFNVNKCICLLSHWPFFDTFKTFLNFLYEQSVSGSNVPIERYISHFLENVPFPSPQRPRILVQLSAIRRVGLYQPEDIPLPRSGAGFRELLFNLSSEDYLLILLLVLTEHKILVHSLRSNVLTSVVEALSMIMFPFKWQCPYIPLCPLGLAEVLHAPVPFLIGVDSRFFDMYDPPSDVTCIDLDTCNITLSEEKKNLSYKLLPKRAAKTLRHTLETLCKKCNMNKNAMFSSDCFDEDYDDGTYRFKIKDLEQKMELEIQEAFLRFMATILKGYRSYLLPIVKAPTVGTTDPKSLFDLQGFLKSRERSDHKFFVMLMKTQMFIRFIEERSFVSDMDVGLAFFDECTEKIEDIHGRLLEFEEFEESHRSERTVFIPPPEPTGLPPGVIYTYQGFNLDSTLFKNRDIKNSLKVPSQENVPGSPMARRTKHEVKLAQKLARRKHLQSPQSWAKYLLTTCYSLWFIHLPSFVINDSSKSSNCLRIAYELLVKIQKLKLHPTDEVCYRVMMQLFGIYSQPVLAVNLLSHMKSCGIQPNALTYGYYNRAVLEATWPSDQSHPSQLWSKLRNVIVGAALFRRGGHRAKHRLSKAESSASIASEKGDLVSELEKSMRKRLGSIMRPTSQNLQELVSYQPLQNSAGILMTGLTKSPPLTRRLKNATKFSPILHQGNPNVSSDVNPVRLRRGSMSPTVSENDTLKFLMKCDSFANDTSILEKHTRTKKIIENNQNRKFSKALSVPRESSESLDITDDPSMEDSWNSHPNINSNEGYQCSTKFDTPARNFITKLNCLAMDWNSNDWKTSQESIDSAPSYNCNIDQQNLKEKGYQLKKPPWKSSEELLTSCEGDSLSSNEKRCQRSVSESRDCSEKDHKDTITSYSQMETNPDMSFNNISDGISKMTLNTSQASEIYIDEDNKPLESLKTSIKIGSNLDKKIIGERLIPSNSAKTSPLRTPVTENDPLGALQCKEEMNGTGNESLQPVDVKNSMNSCVKIGDHGSPSHVKYDLLFGGLFSHHPSRSSKKEGEPNNCLKTRKREPEKSNQEDGSVASLRVPKSATFHNGRQKETKFKGTSNEEDTNYDKTLQRSTTLPDTVSTGVMSTSSSVASSLSSFSSNFKFSFSRYSPSRFSLKKSDLRIAKTQILENAISGSKKSNELLLSGFNTVKSAASSVAKKIEEVISTNSTPVKLSNLSHDFEEEEADYAIEKNATLDFESWGTNLKEFFGDGSRKGSSANLQPSGTEDEFISEDIIAESLYGKNSSLKSHDTSNKLTVAMTTCCKCNNCCLLLHDEEIIAGWTPDDSNLNTKCHFCEKPTLPFISITIYDCLGKSKKCSAQKCNISQNLKNRSLTIVSNLSDNDEISIDPKSGMKEEFFQVIDSGIEKSSTDTKKDYFQTVKSETFKVKHGNCEQNCSSRDNTEKTNSNEKINENNLEPLIFEPIIVPYLNPLVLRKELENILHHEGDPCLTKPSFVDQHPIVFWNLIWMFERINFTSHLPGLILQSSIVKKNKEPSGSTECDIGSISIKCLWDNPRLYEEIGQPMYMLWHVQNQQSPLVSALVTDRITMPRSVMQNIINNLRRDKLYESMRMLVNERTKIRHSHSLYRDILFLAIAACDRANIILDSFDREYSISYDRLRAEDISLLDCDKPPVSASYRNYFRPLLLSHQIN